MNTMILPLVVALGASQVMAEEEMTHDEACGIYHETALTVMKSHQLGVPLMKVMELFGNAPNADAQEFINNIILAAYEKPTISTEEYKQKAANEFANRVAVECYKLLGH